MKINWILPEVTPCGGVRVALEYANMLTDMGHDVVCYAPKSGQHYGWKKILFIKEVIRMKNDSDLRGEWFTNKFDFEFPVWINDKSVRDADITIATSWITSYWVKDLTKNKGKKVYFIQDFETWGNKLYNKRVLESYKFPFDEFITVSTALHDKILNETGINSKIVCNGVEDCFLRKTNKSYRTVTIGMPYREMRGNDVKNCELGIRVLLKIKEKYPDVRVAAFGFKKPENWNKKIDFYENPTRSELVDFYNEINIFYVPSVYEGWGLPAMEAMAQENIVVAAKSGLIEEIGIDKYNCVIIDDPTDENEAIQKISQLIDDCNEVREIGHNARESVLKMSTLDSCNAFFNLLKSTVDS